MSERCLEVSSAMDGPLPDVIFTGTVILKRKGKVLPACATLRKKCAQKAGRENTVPGAKIQDRSAFPPILPKPPASRRRQALSTGRFTGMKKTSLSVSSGRQAGPAEEKKRREWKAWAEPASMAFDDFLLQENAEKSHVSNSFPF